ncbi:MAG: substrate-binding domain-containing protein [Cyanobacteria bacterium P01_G01_bin.54]
MFKHLALPISAALLLLVSGSESLHFLELSHVGRVANAQASFPLPADLPTDTSLVIDGSSSMILLNQALKAAFEARYPDSQVQLSVSDSDGAIARLVDGEIDLAAIARPLTPEEQDQGLETLLINREKIAIVVGPDNPFTGDLSFTQFAQIFRGEITDWSEVGGEPGPIRLVDRPDTSDTRRSLGTYKVFQTAPFATGSTAIRLGKDDTAAMIAALDDDGVGYAIADQVIGLDTVNIVPMHKTLPDDPRYPYSQPRGYVYRAGDDAAQTLAFLGLATSAPGQAAITDAQDADAEAVQAAVAAAIAATGSAGATNSAASSATNNPEAEDSATGESSETDPSATADSATGESSKTDPSAIADSATGESSETADNAAASSSADSASSADDPDGPASDATTAGAGQGSDSATDEQIADAETGGDRATAQQKNNDNAFPWWLLGLLAIPLIGLFLAGLWGRNHPKSGTSTPSAGAASGSGTTPPPTTPASPAAPTSPPANTPSGAGAAALGAAGVAAGAAAGVGTGAGAAAAGAGTGSGSDAAGAAALGAAAAGAGLAAAGLAASGAKPGQPPTPETPAAPPATDSSATSGASEGAEPSKPATGTGSGLGALAAGAGLAAGAAGLAAAAAATKKPEATPTSEPTKPTTTPTPGADAETTSPAADPAEPTPTPTGAGGAGAIAAGAGLVAAAGLGAAAAALGGDKDATTAKPTPPSKPDPAGAVTLRTDCEVQHLTVESRRHCFVLSPSRMEALQNQAASERLEPGTYVIRIKTGGFNDNAPRSWAQPTVLLWIYGGSVINHKTRCQVPATWSSLNGYEDSLTLTVVESCIVNALFFDSYVEDNTGEVTLSIAQLYT